MTADKQSKASVDYRPGAARKRCGLCIMFRPPDQCTAVNGTISASAVCNLFEAKKDKA